MTQTFGSVRWRYYTARIYHMDDPESPVLQLERGGFVSRYAAWDWLVENVGEFGEVRGDDAGNFTEAKPIYACVRPAGMESFGPPKKNEGSVGATAIIPLNRLDGGR